MYSDDKMEGILEKMSALIKYLNVGEDNKYRFYDPELKNKRLTKLFSKINEMTDKISKVLENLLQQLQEKNESISKVWVI